MEVIRLKHEWHGQPAGTIVKITDDCANTMFQKDAAEKMEPENNRSIKDKLQRMVAGRGVKASTRKEQHPDGRLDSKEVV
jgi:hypothetical protein